VVAAAYGWQLWGRDLPTAPLTGPTRAGWIDPVAPAAGQDGENGQADALDVLIAQERQLVTHYEARQARAEGTAAAAITAVLALAALTATAARTSDEVDKTFGWVVVGVLACACVAALVVRSVAGLRHTSTSVLSMGSAEFGTALEHLRACGSTNLDPIDVRQRTLALCQQRADDAHDAAKSKDRWAALAAIALAVAVALTASFAVNLFTV
jgi:hypothetical protein